MNFFGAGIEEELLEHVKKEIKEEREKKAEGKELKNDLEEFSTKFGEDE